VLVIHELGETAIFPKCIGEDLARVVRSRVCVVPLIAKTMDKVFNEGFNVTNGTQLLREMSDQFSSYNLRRCDNEGCVKIETIEQHFKFCSRCNVPRYCSAVCQKIHWDMEHKVQCFTVNCG